MRSRGRVVLVAVAAATTALGAILAVMPGASAATNAITNPGFETGNLSGWTCDASDSVVTGHAHSGTFALSGAAGADTAQCAPTPTPTGSGRPPNNGAFRNPVYFMPLDNNPQNITDAINATGDKNFNLAFVLDSGGCTPAWDGDAAHKVSSDTTVTGVVSAVRAKGGDVAVSFGGI